MFEHVVPVSLALEFLREDPSDKEIKEDIQIIAGLVPEALMTNSDFKAHMLSLQSLWVEIFLGILDHPEASKMSAPDVMTNFPDSSKNLEEALIQLTKRFGLSEAPVVYPAALLDSGQSPPESTDGNQDVALTLSRLRLIDVSKASWGQVIELRKDKEARQKLRRLRLFAADNYSGKSLAYIEDDLSGRIYDYEEEARRWGFETTYSVLTTLLNSKAMGAALAGSLVSILLGSPTVALTAALGGACVEVGRIAVEVSRKRFVLRNGLKDNPISYIVEANERLKQN